MIAGRPNVGKSSLVNRLLNQERVIVNPTPGTTRDIIEEVIAIDGAPIVITDTAGIHDSHDPVETIGIQKSWAVIEKADLVLFMIDGSRPVQVEDQALYESLLKREHLVVRNKIDLCDEPPGAEPGDPFIVRLSARTGAGTDALRERLRHMAGYRNLGEGAFTARQRHVDALQRGAGHFAAGREALAATRAGELLAEELRLAHEALGEITGAVSSDDLLGMIFASFCIGK